MNIYDHYETVLPLFLSSQTFSHILRDKPVVHAKKNSQKKNFAHFSFYKDKKNEKRNTINVSGQTLKENGLNIFLS